MELASLRSDFKAIALSSAAAVMQNKASPSYESGHSGEHLPGKEVVELVKKEMNGLLQSLEPRIRTIEEAQNKTGGRFQSSV